MATQISLTCEVESVWVSFKFSRIYITAKTTEHVIADNRIFEEKDRKISIVYNLKSDTELTAIINRKSPNLKFEVDANHTNFVDRNGYVLKRYQALSLSQWEQFLDTYLMENMFFTTHVLQCWLGQVAPERWGGKFMHERIKNNFAYSDNLDWKDDFAQQIRQED